MNYPDGRSIEPGDLVLLDGTDRGRVVASMDTGRHLPEHDGWAYLGGGIMVDTDFAGLVHYTSLTVGTIEFLERATSPK